jgi:hypothetical protein
MSFLRRRLSWMLAGWLVFQIAGVLVPVALAASGHGHDETVCTCPAGGHSTSCPMHHDSDQSRSEKPPQCVLQNAAAAVDVALLSLSTGGGILPQAMALDTGVGLVTSIITPSSVVTSRVELPASPPPRA